MTKQTKSILAYLLYAGFVISVLFVLIYWVITDTFLAYVMAVSTLGAVCADFLLREKGKKISAWDIVMMIVIFLILLTTIASLIFPNFAIARIGGG